MAHFDFGSLGDYFKKLEAAGFKIDGAGPRTPILAYAMAVITLAHVIEVLKVEGPGGDAERAFDLISDAAEILARYPVVPKQ